MPERANDEQRDRRRGATLGLAIGDALETWAEQVLPVDPSAPWNRKGAYHPARLMDAIESAAG